MKKSLTLLLALPLAALAQKLPSVQANSVYAPASIKIDGRTTEWNDKFQAYNNHVECFYTLSNDDQNLYLTIQAVDRTIVRRIINGGITLAVNKTGKKNDKESSGVTFPLFDKDNRFTPRYTGSAGGSAPPPPMAMMDMLPSMAGAGAGGAPMGVRTISINGSPMNSTPLTPAQLDSVMRANNTSFAAKAKTIGLKGFKDLDSTLSVYNEEGLKAAGTFDNKTNFTCELAVPLKYFGLDAGSKFVYHVIINKVEQRGVDIQQTNGPDGAVKSMSVHMGPNSQMGQDATDFWGDYTLAKKP